MDASLLPIDIHSNKLIEWLMTRRVCQRHWLKDVTEARRRLQQLAQSDMDKQGVDLELQAALQQPHVTFWHCEQIAQALKKIEASNKSVLFGYSSTVIRELDAILKVFRRGNCYLADAGRLLNKAAQEDAPYLKRQAERQRRRQADCERKRGEHAAAGADAKAKFLGLCKQLGLSQQLDLRCVRDELAAQAERLPRWYDTDCVEALRRLREPLGVYADCVRHTVGHSDLCPTLSLISSVGNCTQYQLLRGRPPTSVEPFCLQLPDAGGDAGDVDGDDAVIDWDAGDIGDDVIDFGIEDVSGVEDTTKEAKEEEEEDGVARGELARSVLDCRDLREQLLDDLHELAAFLGRLGSEQADHGNSIAQSVLAGCPASIQSANCPELEGRVRGVIADLTEPSRQHVMLIRAAPSYICRLLRRFQALQDQATKAAAAARLCEQRQLEAVEEEKSQERQLASLRKQLSELKRRVESDLSQRHDNRRVNIMGEINAV